MPDHAPNLRAKLDELEAHVRRRFEVAPGGLDLRSGASTSQVPIGLPGVGPWTEPAPPLRAAAIGARPHGAESFMAKIARFFGGGH